MSRGPFEPPKPPRRPVAWSVAATLVTTVQAALFGLLALRPPTPETPGVETVIVVELMPPAPPPPDPTETAKAETSPDATDAAAPAAPEPARAPTPATRPPIPTPRPPRPAPPQIETLPVAAVIGPPDLPLIGGARLAGALRAGGGGTGQGAGGGDGIGAGAGGDCDMVARLEAALRDTPVLRQAVDATLAARDARGQAVLVWDGDWLQSPGEAGRGLAGVRQAVAVEVGFAPRHCRDAPVRGLVVLALDRSANGPKVALGAPRWRWRDLLGL